MLINTAETGITKVFSGKELPLNQLLNFKIDKENLVIPEDNRHNILDYIYSLNDEVSQKINRLITQHLNKGFDWRWSTDKGKLPKRIAKAIAEYWPELKLNEKDLAEIGDLALEGMPKSNEYNFDISTTLNWRKGDFGDRNSCFLSRSGNEEYSQVKTMRKAKEFYALRYFKDFGYYDEESTSISQPNVAYFENDHLWLGISRMWLYRKSDDELVAFNSYGYDTTSSSEVLAQYLGAKKTQVPISAPIMVNNAGKGYWISNRQDKPNKINIPNKYQSYSSPWLHNPADGDDEDEGPIDEAWDV